MKILLTGGAGFIGSAVVRRIIDSTDHSVFNVDKLTYAGNLQSVSAASNSDRYQFSQTDICDRAALQEIFESFQPDAVMHLAAETHVDRSITGPADFMTTNLMGTYTLLEVAADYWSALDDRAKRDFRFHHVSTDEVYGDLGPDGAAFTEATSYKPSSPYSASKAGADHLVRAWHRTYGLPTLISNCSNNYGPYQFPEKLIPLVIRKAVRGESIPVYGDGRQVRDWLYVEDHARALCLIVERGEPGETFNVGGRAEKQNVDVVSAICDTLDRLLPSLPTGVGKRQDLISYVTDRPGHDFRYAIDSSFIERRLGWTPAESFETGLEKTVRWYLEHAEWSEAVVSASEPGAAVGGS